MKRTLTPFVGLLCGLLLLTTPTGVLAQSLAQKTAQAEAVAAQNDAPSDDAKTIAQTLAEAFGQRSDTAALIAAAQALAAANPSEAAAIAAAAAVFSPNAAPRIAAAVASTVPAAAPAIAAAVAAAVPSQAAAVAGAVSASVPQAATDVAGSVSQSVPSAESAVVAAVIAAVPAANAAAIAAAASSGASSGSSSAGGGGGTGFGGGGVNLPSGAGGGGGGGGGGPAPTPAPTPAVTSLNWDGQSNRWITGPGSGGDGTWTNTSPWNPNATAVLGGDPGQIRVQGTVETRRGIDFAENGYEIAGGAIALTGSTNQITARTNVSALIGSSLVGTNGFVKSGSGLLGLSGDSRNLSGTVAVNGGDLVLGTTANLSGADVRVGSAGTLAGAGTIRSGQISGTHQLGFSTGGETADEASGILTVVDRLTYNTGSTLEWSLRANTTLQQPQRGTFAFDSVAFGNTSLVFAGITSFELNFSTLNNPLPPVDWSNSFWSTSYTGQAGWRIFDVPAANVVGFTNLQISMDDWFDRAMKPLEEIRPGAQFVVALLSDGIYLNYIYSQ